MTDQKQTPPPIDEPEKHAQAPGEVPSPAPEHDKKPETAEDPGSSPKT